MNGRVEAVGEFAVRRSRPDATDDEDHTHGERADHGWGEKSTISMGESDEKNHRRRDPFGGPWQKKEFADAIDVGGLERHVGGVTHFDEEGIVHEVNGPDQTDHEPGGDEVYEDDNGGEFHAPRVGGGRRMVVTECVISDVFVVGIVLGWW